MASRVARMNICVDKSISCTINDSHVVCNGKHGCLDVNIPSFLKVINNNDSLQVLMNEQDGEYIRTKEKRHRYSMQGTTVRKLNNAIQGVTNPFEKQLTIKGIGYKCMLKEKQKEGEQVLEFYLGYSHIVTYLLPEKIKLQIKDSVLFLKSIDKELLGAHASRICVLKKYNPYSGNGILDSDKIYIRKEAKKK